MPVSGLPTIHSEQFDKLSVSKETACSGEGKIGKTDGLRNGSGSPNRDAEKSVSSGATY